MSIMDRIPDVILVGLAVGVFVGGTVWALAWWLSGQFSDIRLYVHQQISRVEENILDKLEYHEKHDDTRFATIRNDIWEIRVRNASRDGLAPLVEKKQD